MNNSQTLGFLAIILLVIGCFVPLMSVPILGSINYFQNGKGDGIIILVLCFVSTIILFGKNHKWLYLTGIFSIILIGNTFLNVLKRKGEFDSEIASNPFGSLVSNTIQMEWGWALLGIGSLLLLLAAAAPKRVDSIVNVVSQIDTEATKECPYCAETIKYEAVVCRYCGKDIQKDNVQQQDL